MAGRDLQEKLTRSRPLRILSWNINGIRASKVNLKELFDSLQADVICLQETKVTRDLLDEEVAAVQDYNSYFAFSRKRSGYSGVATYCHDSFTPFKAEEGLSGLLPSGSNLDAVGSYGRAEALFSASELKALDSEGRAVLTQHKFKTDGGTESTLTIINVYCPRADPEKPERETFKLQFYDLIQARAEALLESGSHVVIVGDINTSHKLIDHCDPQEKFADNPGRKWLDKFIGGDIPSENTRRFSDSFRHFHPEEKNAFTCWCTRLNARANNYGTRLDYVLVDSGLLPHMEDSLVLQDIKGSDHCPVQGIFHVHPVQAPKCPSFCTKNFPEFAGKQQSLLSIFSKMKNDNSEKKPSKSPAKRSRSPQKSSVKKVKLNPKGKQQNISMFFVKKDVTTATGKDNVPSETSVLIGDLQSQSNGSEELPESTLSIENSSEELSSNSLSQDLSQETKSDSVTAWRSVLTGPKSPPKCKGHGEPCALRTVKKKGPNMNRQFWVCARGEGHSSNSQASCNYFQWLRTGKKQQ